MTAAMKINLGMIILIVLLFFFQVHMKPCSALALVARGAMGNLLFLNGALYWFAFKNRGPFPLIMAGLGLSLVALSGLGLALLMISALL